MCLAIFILSFILFVSQLSTGFIITWSILGVIFILLEGYICGRVCVDIIQRKDEDSNAVLWFWLGFIFSWVAILLTLVVKDRNK